MSEYDYYRKSAHPWGIAWPKLKYIIMDKSSMLVFRRELSKTMASTIPNQNNITEKELQLPYDQYLVPEHLFDGTNPLDNDLQSIEYDPFELFNKTPSQKRIDLPYADFATLDIKDNMAIVEFANKHGLLGIFFHRYYYLPLVYPADDYDAADTAKVKFEFRNTNDVKRRKIIHLSANNGLWFSKPANKEGLVPMSIKQINDDFFPFQLDPYEAVDLSLKYYDKLTPLLADKELEFPINWWYLYCEPLPLFIKEVERFKSIFTKLLELNEQKDEIERTRDLNYVLFHLRQNLETVHPVPKHSKDIKVKKGIKNFKDSLIDGWNFPSLLSAYYLMLYLQISGNRKSRLCARKRCRRPFFINRKDNLYCSDACQAAEKTQRQRDYLKELVQQEEDVRNQYLPEKIKYLLVMGLPEDALQTFSYSKVSVKRDKPFMRTVFAFYHGEYSKAKTVNAKKDEILQRFKQDGIFVIDAIDRNRSKEYSPATIKRLIKKVASKDTKIILVGVSEKANRYIQRSDYWVIDNINPYPDDIENGKLYESKLKILLEKYS
jgi:hypothetical protein